MHQKKKGILILQYLFLVRGVGTNKKITLKIIVQGLLQLYNKNLSLGLTKIKKLLMASISEVELNIESQIIHLALNIHVQQNISKHIESIIKSNRETHMFI
jgi:hypothetical protein